MRTCPNPMMVPFARYVREWFDFPSTETFCQIATVSDCSPSLRTMRLYDVHDSHLVFFTRTDTKKWTDLNHNPRVAVHLLNEARGQIAINGVATCHTRETNYVLVSRYWHNMTSQGRALYGANNKEDEMPAHFGVINVSARCYDFLIIDKDNYLKSTRFIYFLDGTRWRKKSGLLS